MMDSGERERRLAEAIRLLQYAQGCGPWCTRTSMEAQSSEVNWRNEVEAFLAKERAALVAGARDTPPAPDAKFRQLVDDWEARAIQLTAYVSKSSIRPTDSEMDYQKVGTANGLYEAAVDLETLLRAARAGARDTPPAKREHGQLLGDLNKFRMEPCNCADLAQDGRFCNFHSTLFSLKVVLAARAGDDAPPTNFRLTGSSLVVGDDAPTPQLSVEIQEGYEPRCPEIASFEKRCSRQEGHPGHHDWTAVAPGAAALREAELLDALDDFAHAAHAVLNGDAYVGTTPEQVTAWRHRLAVLAGKWDRPVQALGAQP